MESDQIKQRAKAFDYLFDAVVVTNNEGQITDWNKGSEDLYGYSAEEAIGQHVSMLHVPEDVDHITSAVIAAVAKDGRWTGEVRSLHKSGKIGWIESICIPITDDQQAMVGALGINRDITKRKQEAEHLQRLAHYDHLTQLPNRYLLLDRVGHLIAQAERNDNSFGLLYIDLDKFKDINDTKGHAFGDKVLQEIAARMLHSIRRSDTIARIGGDEFILLLENTSDKLNISAIAESLCMAIKLPLQIEGSEVSLSCSVGIAIFPENGSDTDALMAAADKAMYKAKNAGKGGYSF